MTKRAPKRTDQRDSNPAPAPWHTSCSPRAGCWPRIGSPGTDPLRPRRTGHERYRFALLMDHLSEAPHLRVPERHPVVPAHRTRSPSLHATVIESRRQWGGLVPPRSRRGLSSTHVEHKDLPQLCTQPCCLTQPCRRRRSRAQLSRCQPGRPSGTTIRPVVLLSELSRANCRTGDLADPPTPRDNQHRVSGNVRREDRPDSRCQGRHKWQSSQCVSTQ